MEGPEIVRVKSFKLVGRRVVSDGRDRKIMQLWHSFLPESETIPGRINCCSHYGCLTVLEEELDENGIDIKRQLEYIAAVQVEDFSSVPEGMVTKAFPDQLYARFIHRGTLLRIRELYNYIFTTWMPFSGYERSGGPDFQHFGKRFISPENSNSILELYIAVKKV